MKKITAILFILFLGACDILETRDAEEPERGRSNFLIPTTPDMLFENLINSFSEKIIENYTACFADTAFSKKKFSFIPSPGSVSRFPQLASWGREEEKQYFTNLISASSEGSPITVVFSNSVSTLLADSADYTFDYTINLISNNESIPGGYEGSVRFKVHLDNREQWVINSWEDIKKGELNSWSELKGRFY